MFEEISYRFSESIIREARMTKISFLSALHLKILMCTLMVLDHIRWFFPGTPYAFHQFGRLVLPVFAFLIAQGMVHTRNRRDYIVRLFLFGAVTMVVGQQIASFVRGGSLPFNIPISFAIAAMIIVAVDNVILGDKRIPWLLSIIPLAGAALLFEGAWMVTVPVLIFYYLRDRPLMMCSAYVATSPLVIYLTLQILSAMMGVTFSMPSQWLMIFGIVPIMLYNGKRGAAITGRAGFAAKYAFYVFYPLHLWVFYLVANL